MKRILPPMDVTAEQSAAESVPKSGRPGASALADGRSGEAGGCSRRPPESGRPESGRPETGSPADPTLAGSDAPSAHAGRSKEHAVVQYPVVLPALLLCDFGHLAREVSALQDAGARGLHLDVMDGRFVPQLTYGPIVVSAVRRASRVPIEVHLMIEQPERTVGDYLAIGPDVVTVHVEALRDASATLRAIRDAGAAAHLAISPSSPIDALRPHLGACDGVLVMGVEPGFGGQSFLPATIGRLEAVRALRESGGYDFAIAVDGGISVRTIASAAAAGADRFVAGSAVIRAADYATAIRSLESLAREAA